MVVNTITKKIFSPFKKAGKVITNLMLPSLCITCHEILNEPQGLGFCHDCWKELPFCKHKDTQTSSQITLEANSPINSFQSVTTYETPISGLVKQLKFNDSPELSKPLANLMLKQIPKDLENPLLIAVPMSKKRLWWRQFNQAELLTKHIAKTNKLSTAPFALTRIKHTAHQIGKSAQQRRNNLSKAFQADREQILNQDIILIDDVWTTGTTCKVCARVLKQAGAKSVHVLTLAYVKLEK